MTVLGANQYIATVLAVSVSFSTLFTEAHQRFLANRLQIPVKTTNPRPGSRFRPKRPRVGSLWDLAGFLKPPHLLPGF